MSMRAFAIALPADTNTHSLYTLMLAQTGAIPTEGILPDRGNALQISPASGNAGTVTIQDAAANGGVILAATSPAFVLQTQYNSICFKDFYVKGSVNSQNFSVLINWA